MVFQKEDIDVSSISSSVDRCLQTVDRAEHGKGIYQEEFRSHTVFTNDKYFSKEKEVAFEKGHVDEVKARKKEFDQKTHPTS